MSQSVSVDDLFQQALADGAISAAGMKALKVANYGAAIQANLGITPADVKVAEVVLLNLLIDDSGSIEDAGNTGALIDGVNGVMDALAGAKKRDDVLVYIELLNRGLLQSYALLKDAARLSVVNFKPYGSTPLFAKAVPFLGTIIAKSQEFALSGVACRTVSLIATDGGDNTSGSVRARDVASVAKDMLAAESHIIFGYGISDGITDFRKVFAAMGLKPNAIRTSANDPKEIRKEFQLFSQSAVRASQNAQSFSKVAGGGFAN
ncbi:MAG: hypothetical protein Q8R35_04170 [bacterium]|nr:hypothetical protein [bacterium]